MRRNVLIALAALLTSVPSATAQTFTDTTSNGQVLYFKIANGAATLTYERTANPRYTSLVGDVVIPDSVALDGVVYAVTRIDNNAFNRCSDITSITIPAPVTSVGSSAFAQCTSLVTLNFNAESCTQMGSGVFTGCSALTTLNIGGNVKCIPSGFNSCTALEKTNFLGSVEQWMAINLRYNPIQQSRNLYLNDVLLFDLVIPEGITQVGAHFSYDTALITITLPQGVTSIGNKAFQNCAGLTSLTLPQGVTSIGDYAFQNCTGLTSITIPQGVTSIGDYAFQNCTGLTSITIPQGVTSIGDYAFQNCSGLTSITIPQGVTNIGSDAFQNCTGLTTVSLPQSLVSIGMRAFRNCTDVNNITIPETVISIGSYAFDGVMHIEYHGNATGAPWGALSMNGVVEDGFVFSDSSKHKVMFYIGESDSATVPSTVDTINDKAFYNNKTIVSVTIPPSVVYIGKQVFENCTSLGSVSIPTSVVHIGHRAFSNVRHISYTGSYSSGKPWGAISINGFEEAGFVYADSNRHNLWAYIGEGGDVVVPNMVDTISQKAFYGHQGVLSITIPPSTVRFGNLVFEGCTSLTTVNFNADSCTQMSGIFTGCSALTTVNIGDNVKSIPGGAFKGCTGLTSVTLPDSVRSIGKYAFQNCTGLTTITIPPSVTNCGEELVSGCTNLVTVNFNADSCTSNSNNGIFNCTSITTVNIGDNVKSIPRGAFKGCTGLTSVTLPDSVRSIGEYAFQNCTGLTTITIPPSVTDCGTSAFSGCTGLVTVNFNADSCTSTSIGIFYNCTSITTVNIGDNVKSIPGGAFNGCTGLTSVTLPNSVKSIEKCAFLNCRALTSLTLPQGLSTIGNQAFSRCSGLTTITIPPSVTDCGSSAFSGCTGLVTVNFNADSCVRGSTIFYGCYALDTVVFGANVRSIPARAFSDMYWMPSLTVPSTVSTIGPDAFLNHRMIYYGGTATGSPWGALCVNGYEEDSLYYADSTKVILVGAHPKLRSVIVPTSVRQIGPRAFYNCDSLRMVVLHDSISRIEDYTFSGCQNLSTIIIPESVIYIGESAFSNCGLDTIVIPASVVYIGGYAFSGCGFDAVVIPENVEYIGGYAFPSTVKTVVLDADSCAMAYAFANCLLENIVVGDNVRYITRNAFGRTETLHTPDSVKIGRGVISVGDYAFSGMYRSTNYNDTSNYVHLVMNADSLQYWGKGNCFNPNIARYTCFVEIEIGKHVTKVPSQWFDSTDVFRITSHARLAPEVLGTVRSSDWFYPRRPLTVPCLCEGNYSVSPWNRMRIGTSGCTGWDNSSTASPFVEILGDETRVVTPGDSLTLTARHIRRFGTGADGYSVGRIPYTPADITFSRGTRYVGADDMFGPEVQIGFPFYFYGQLKSHFRQGTNGMVGFATMTDTTCPAPGSAPLPWPDSTEGAPANLTAMRDAIYGMFEDTRYDTTMLTEQQGMFYGVEGTSPNRRIVCSWNEVPQYGCNDNRSTYQVVGYEGSNIVEVHVKNRLMCEEWQQGRGIAGIQNADGTDALYPNGETYAENSWEEVSLRFTPNPDSVRYSYRWLRILDDGRQEVIANMPGEDTAASDDQYIAQTLVTLPDDRAWYVFEVTISDTTGTMVYVTLSDTVRVQMMRNVAVTTSDTLLGTADGSGAYHDDETVTMKAYAKMHCRFDGWSDGMLDNPRRLIVTGDTTITALFEACDTVHKTDTLAVISDTTWVVDTLIVHDAVNAKWLTGPADERPLMDATATADSTNSHLYTNTQRMFIPDICAENPTATSTISVFGFPEGAQVLSPDGIVSVCINIEHSYLGDLDIVLKCPTHNDATEQGVAVLHYGVNTRRNVPSSIPDGTRGGGGRLLGIPYGGNNDGFYDVSGSCDSTQNPYGLGYDYCFSRNASCTLVNGQPADTPMPDSAALGCTQPGDIVTYTFPPIPDDFARAGESCGTVQVSSIPASNRDERTGYYVPASDFSSLVGCPINGQWELEIRDNFHGDNGWLFGWSIDFGNVIDITSQDTALGTVGGCGTVAPHIPATVMAMPKAGVYFVGWSDGSEENPYTLTVDGDTSLTAYFAEHDSIVFRDTIDVVFIYDTLYRTDTIYIHDTTYVNIAEVQVVDVRVYVSDGNIVVAGGTDAPVWVYDVTGRLLATRRKGVADRELRIPTEKTGVYIVKIGDALTRRIVVVR